MAVKLKLKRMGKIRNPQYRIVVADARAKRDGRAIEEIGVYHPKEEPSLIRVDSARVQYWLGVGAQPTEPVLALLKVTGDWQRFKGLPGSEGTLRTAPPRADKRAQFDAALAQAHSQPSAEATTPRRRRTRADEEDEAGPVQGGSATGSGGGPVSGEADQPARDTEA